jgi:hypothetical protein
MTNKEVFTTGLRDNTQAERLSDCPQLQTVMVMGVYLSQRLLYQASACNVSATT